MKVIIAGGGVGGLVTALVLHARGIDCEIFEQADAIRELGVGINTLPHAIKELAELGLLERLDTVAIRTYELFYTNRFGQEIWREPRGLDAGYDVPQFSIHRGRLQGVIYQAVRARLGESRIHPGHRLGASRQDEAGVTAYFFDRNGAHRATARGDVLVGADGIHSAVRETLFPNEGPARWNGSMLWRGAIDRPLDGDCRRHGGQARDLSDRPRRARGLPAHQLGGAGQNRRTRCATQQGRLVASRPVRRPDAARAAFPYRLCRRQGADRGDAGILGISDVRPRSAAALVAWPRHAPWRRRAPDVSGRLERRVAGDSRCPLTRRPAGCRRAPRPRIVGLRAGTPAADGANRAHEPQR